MSFRAWSGENDRTSGTLRPAAQWVFATHTAAPGGGDLALARYLADSSRKDTALVSLEDGSTWDSVRAAGIEVLVPKQGTSKWPTLCELRETLRSFPDAIFVANSMRMALFMALLLPRKATLVYWVRDGLTESSVSRIGLLITRRFTLRRVDFCIANSRWTATTIKKVCPPMEVAVATSPGGIKAPETAPLPRGIAADDRIRLLYLGRIARWKGVHIAIEAVQRLNKRHEQQFSLDIAGSPLFGEEEYAKSLYEMAVGDECIHFLGHVNNVPELLQNYVGMLHCSTTPEPFGQVIVQGMAAGLIVFASDEGGPAEIITPGEDGYLVEPGNPDRLARAVEDGFADAGRVQKIQENALKSSLAYTDEVTVRRIDELLDQIQSRFSSSRK